MLPSLNIEGRAAMTRILPPSSPQDTCDRTGNIPDFLNPINEQLPRFSIMFVQEFLEIGIEPQAGQDVLFDVVDLIYITKHISKPVVKLSGFEA